MIEQHTPEPWKAEYAREEGCLDIVAKDTGPWDGDVTLAMNIGEANARRIVACVNACAGCDTAFLEAAPIGVFASKYGSPGYVDSLEKQRDELLAALEQFVTWGRMQHKAQSKGCHATFDMMSLKDEIDLAEAVIASVKGGAT